MTTIRAIAVASALAVLVSPSAVAGPQERAVQEARQAVRQATRAAAEADRPGQVKRVGQIDFFKQKPHVVGCTRRHAAASAFYAAAPHQGVFFLCKESAGPWTVYEGPLYGE